MNKFVIVSASTREMSESFRLSKALKNMLLVRDPQDDVHILSLAETRHMEWNERFWREEIPCPEWKRTSALLSSASAFIFVVPEWHGMVPPALINLFMLAERNELAHKPALIVGISSGNGGAYVIAQLKAHCSKNNRVCFIPEQVIVRDIKNKDFEGVGESNGDIARLAYSLEVLRAYAPAFQQVRLSGVLDYNTWPYGM